MEECPNLTSTAGGGLRLVDRVGMDARAGDRLFRERATDRRVARERCSVHRWLLGLESARKGWQLFD
eukprot:438347-Lingulodinium_polyedra.AAC.1